MIRLRNPLPLRDATVGSRRPSIPGAHDQTFPVNACMRSRQLRLSAPRRSGATDDRMHPSGRPVSALPTPAVAGIKSRGRRAFASREQQACRVRWRRSSRRTGSRFCREIPQPTLPRLPGGHLPRRFGRARGLAAARARSRRLDIRRHPHPRTAPLERTRCDSMRSPIPTRPDRRRDPSACQTNGSGTAPPSQSHVLDARYGRPAAVACDDCNAPPSSVVCLPPRAYP